MEVLSPDATRDAALRVLRSLFGADAVPDPVQHLTTRWASEPFSKGEDLGTSSCTNSCKLLSNSPRKSYTTAKKNTF